MVAEEARVEIVVTALERVRVSGNRVWLGSVFANLLTNAIRHSPAGTRAELIVVVDGSNVRCDVTDQGPGVAPADRERIFERFIQGSTLRGSIGLGLYVCRKIITLHGGQIWVEDNPGGGARFAFRIPFANRAEP